MALKTFIGKDEKVMKLNLYLPANEIQGEHLSKPK